jgi:hypothetical protein
MIHSDRHQYGRRKRSGNYQVKATKITYYYLGKK